MSRDPRGIALAVLKEITGRRGFRSTWDSCDPEVQDEILTAIARIIDPGSAPPASGAPEPTGPPEGVLFPVRFPSRAGTALVTEARFEPAIVGLADGSQEPAVGLVSYHPRTNGPALPFALVLLRDLDLFTESLIAASQAHGHPDLEVVSIGQVAGTAAES